MSLRFLLQFLLRFSKLLILLYLWCYCMGNGESNASEHYHGSVTAAYFECTPPTVWEYFGVDREKYYGAEVDELEEE